MAIHKGSCGCGAVTVELHVEVALEEMTPRRCDCDWCMARDGAYISHPEGRLVLCTPEPMITAQHGHGIATFLACPRCGEHMAGSAHLGGVLRGTLRGPVLAERHRLPPAQVGSPKLLSADEKRDRWGRLWLKLEVVEATE